MLSELYNKIKEDKAFRDLFQPISKEEFEKRRKERLDRELLRILREGKCTLNPDGTYSCEGDINFIAMNLTKLPVKFKRVRGNFCCFNNELTSLEGSPREVGEGFYCSYNNLTSLEGGPKKVGRRYYCDNNHLTSLEGAPEKVGGWVYIEGNPIAEELGTGSFPGSELHKYVK